jgi:SAM-dependent methyltransferase
VTSLSLAPIDALGPTVGGRYEDDLIVVEAACESASTRGPRTVLTRHFDVTREAGKLLVSHSVPREQIDDDLAGLLAEELFVPGWLRGPELFERIFTGVVRTSEVAGLDAWELFFRNTLRRLDESANHDPGGVHGCIDGYAPVYEYARSLVPAGSVLELGCCFGFLSIQLAGGGHRVTATDVSAGTIALLEAMAPRLGVTLATRVADAARVQLPDRHSETVLLVHLLEHLDERDGQRALDEALRLAAHRVVVAVPLEEDADETYGHVRTIAMSDLERWGEKSGHSYSVHEHHGGWLVIDKHYPRDSTRQRPSARGRSR